MFNFVGWIGYRILSFLGAIGHFTMFMGMAVGQSLTPPYRPRRILVACLDLALLSLPVVGLTAIFSGMVLVLQSYTGFARFSAESAIPQVVVVSLTRELGPVLAGLMIAGRVGAAIAAELGTMRVSDQIEAMQAMIKDPISYLVVPRLIAGIVAMPILVAVADTIGVLGGYMVAVYRLGFSSAGYLSATLEYLEVFDVVSGLVKAAVFGFIVTVVGAYKGYYASAGAQGVGRATTSAVVLSAILILVSNYLITEAFFNR